MRRHGGKDVSLALMVREEGEGGRPRVVGAFELLLMPGLVEEGAEAARGDDYADGDEFCDCSQECQLRQGVMANADARCKSSNNLRRDIPAAPSQFAF